MDKMKSEQEHPADLADEIERLPVEEAQQEFQELSEEKRAAVLSELDVESRPGVLENLEPAEIARLISDLPHNEAADVLGELDPGIKDLVLTQLSANDREQVSHILEYPPDTAGGIMSDRFIALRDWMTIEQAQNLLRERGQTDTNSEPAYLYVLNASGVLTGIVSVHDLLFRGLTRKIGEVMKTEVQHVSVDDDQEKIARLFQHYHYMALPVLEKNGRLAGVVLASEVMDVLREEATEDMQLMVGLSGEERVLTPWQSSVRKRLPWLCINLATAFLAASVVGLFEKTIAAWTALAVFLPIVAGQGGNAGTQTLTVIIRDMALGEISAGDGKKALFKESFLGLINGVVIGLIVGVVSYMWKGNILLGLVVGAAMVLNMIAAALSGVLVPYTLKALRVDPALASCIMVTTVTDVAGFFFFLGLATLAQSAR